MKKIRENWIAEDDASDIVCKVKCSSLPDISMKQSIAECVMEWFEKVDAIVFIAAAGIAVRSIAPCIRHKAQDPAVVVVDEGGRFSISLLSGHMGGANELTNRIADWIGAVPVVTTATDVEELFAVDDYARRHDLIVTDWDMAKAFSVAVLCGKTIAFYVDEKCSFLRKENYMEVFPQEVYLYKEEIAPEGERADDGIFSAEEEPGNQRGIVLSYRRNAEAFFPSTLFLVPSLFVVGIGCRRGISADRIKEAVTRCLTEENIRIEAVCAVASIDLKKDEAGIVDFCKQENIPFLTYTAEELKKLSGDYSASEFVEQITGVSNVCERSAVAASDGELVCAKRVYDGVTIAIAVRSKLKKRE